MKAKKTAKEHGYKFCWYKDEKILMREFENGAIITICDEEDLDKTFKKARDETAK